jgi:BirA family transcriptional regulator, biotin operon repressor / biotin---[acetyl-CoA-carboxylase] ligase
MTADIRTPEILNDLARAGVSGIDLPVDMPTLRDLELCREWDFPVRTNPEGRAVLDWNPESLVPAWIEAEAAPRLRRDLHAEGYLRIGSTNDEASSLARSGVPEGWLVCAEQQTAGRGRKGRRWNSPPRAGLYFSLVIRPEQRASRWPLLTYVAAVALFDTLRQVPGPPGRALSLDLKWPNDVILSGRKCAGILLETAGGPGAMAAIVGVGINVRPESVARDLMESATSIESHSGAPVPRRALLVSFLDEFYRLYALFEAGAHAEILDRWKASSSMWDGAEVTIIDGSVSRTGVTCGLTDTGALRVRLAGGTEESILSGDVTVRRAER